METRTVKVGERDYRIGAFSGYKAVHIGRIVAKIGKQVPELIDDMNAFTRRFEAENSLKITRAMSVLPRFKPLFDDMQLSDEDWQRCGGAVEIPQPADANMVIASVFPKAFEYAEDSVLDLLAWIASTNVELSEADENDGVDEHIKSLRKRLLHEGALDELVTLALVGVEIVREQLQSQVAEVGKAISTLMGRQEDSQTSSTESEAGESEDSDEATSTTSQNLSTDSPTPTGGTDAPRSTEPASVT
jgi:hypothetical protein